MAAAAADQRAEELATRARTLLSQRQHQQAALLAKEAGSLAPENASVRALIRELTKGEANGQILPLVQSYVEHGDEESGREALKLITGNAVPASDVARLAHLIFDHDGRPAETRDELTGAFLAGTGEARRQLANRVQVGAEATRYFRLLWRRGEHSFNSILPVLLDSAAWPDAKAQSNAKRDVFLLALGKLLDPALEHGEWSMTLVARLLTDNAHELAGLIDRDAFEIVLAQLDIRLDAKIRAQATLAVAKLLEETRDEGEATFSNFVTSTVAKGYNDELIVAFSAAAGVFPLAPQVVARLFLTPGFLEGLVPALEKNLTGQRKSHKLELAAMEMMSSACVDKSCRESISKVCYGWLDEVAHTSTEADAASMAALVLAKIPPKPDEQKSGVSHADDLSTMLMNMTMRAPHSANQHSSIEGLAYTSLQPKIKQDIVAHRELVSTLISRLKASNAGDPSVFGILTIFANLVTYRPPLTPEQQKMSQLKSYAEAKGPGAPDPLDDDSRVSVRCRAVLDAGLVPVLVSTSKPYYTPTILGLVSRILHALGREQKHRGTLAQQGAVKLLLQTLDRLRTPVKTSDDTARARLHAAHALARILISVDPHHVFSATVPAIAALRPLTALLTPADADADAETRDLLPVFESLLALTNLASLDDDAVRDAVVRTAWPAVEDLLLASNAHVQRAAVELVCNLMAAPSCVAKFADGSGPAKHRLHVLLALADARDVATRRAAGGALATLTEWDAAADAVVSHDRAADILLSMADDDSVEVQHRGFVCLLNVVSAPGPVGVKGREAVKASGGVEVLKGALQRCANVEVLGIGVEVLKALVGDGSAKKELTQG